LDAQIQYCEITLNGPDDAMGCSALP